VASIASGARPRARHARTVDNARATASESSRDDDVVVTGASASHTARHSATDAHGANRALIVSRATRGDARVDRMRACMKK